MGGVTRGAEKAFEIFIHYGFPGWYKRPYVMSFNGNSTADETYMRVWANGRLPVEVTGGR